MKAHDQAAGSLCPLAPSLAALLAQEAELYLRQGELTREQIGEKTPAESLAVQNRLQIGRFRIDEIGRQIEAMIRTHGLAGAP